MSDSTTARMQEVELRREQQSRDAVALQRIENFLLSASMRLAKHGLRRPECKLTRVAPRSRCRDGQEHVAPRPEPMVGTVSQLARISRQDGR